MIQVALNGNNYCTTSGLLTATGAETVYDTTVTIGFVLDGKLATKGAITDGVTVTTDYNTGLAFPALVGGASVSGVVGHGCQVVWGLISGGTVKCVMGSHEALDITGAFVNPPPFPSIPNGMAPFAYQVLKAGATASASAIIFGTANWNATGFTNAIVNIASLPNRPQVS
jgi:hypothetical protein